MAASDSYASNISSETLASSVNQQKAISRGLFRSVIALSEASIDFLTCAAGTSAAYFLHLSLRIGEQIRYPVRVVAAAGIVVGVLTVFLFNRDGAYRDDDSLLQVRETERALRVSIQSLLLLLSFSFLLNLHLSSAAFLIALFVIPLLLILQKQIFASIVRILHVRGYGIDRVVVYGAGDTGRHVVSTLLHSPRLGLHPVAIIDDNPTIPRGSMPYPGYRFCGPASMLHGLVTPELLKSCRCDMLIIAIPNLSLEKLTAAAHAAKEAGSRIAFLPGPAVQAWQWTESGDIEGPLLTALTDPVAHWYYALVKRTADLVLSSLLLLLLTPLFGLIALLIRLDSPGPALFVQKRVRTEGTAFRYV